MAERRGTEATRRAPVSAAVLLLSACVGSGQGVPWADPEEQGLAPTTFQEIQVRVFDLRCAPACHSGGSASRGLSLEPGLALPGLVDVASNEVPDLLRVAPGRPADSYLVAKIAPSDPRRVGNRMPRNGPPFLSTAEIRAVERWIAAGAKADWEDDDPVDPVVVDDDSAGDDDSASDDDSAGDDDSAMGRGAWEAGP